MFCGVNIINENEMIHQLIKQSDWRRMSTSLLDKLKYILMNGLMADLTVRLINGENIMYKVHKLIFQLASEVFDRMINSTFKEGLSNMIEIKDVEPETFQLFLNHLYGQPLIITHKEQAFDLLQLADCYLIHSLKEDIINLYKTTETPDSACIGLEVADKCEAPMLREAKLEVVESPNFLKASLETVETILEQDKFSIREIDLFEAVRVWIQHNLAEKGESIKEILMPKLRYSSMSLSEFVDGPMASKLLKYDDLVHLMSHLIIKNRSVPMPAGISEAKRIYTNQLTTESLECLQQNFRSSHFYVTTNKRIILTHFFIYPALEEEEEYKEQIRIFNNDKLIARFEGVVNVVDKIEIKLDQNVILKKNEKYILYIETTQIQRKVVNLSNQTINCENISFKFEKYSNYDPCLPLHSFLFEC